MPFRSQPQRLVPFSECKSTAFLLNHQTFFALFSRPFCRKYAHFMHKALKNSRFTHRKNFQLFWPRTVNVRRRYGSCKKKA